MQKFKVMAGRGFNLAAALGLFGGIAASAAFPVLASADALNPLTERTLLLSSSAPGYVDTDGSGNPTYAPPNSGPNGKKTGETFTFKISTTEVNGTASTHIKAMTFQYCTTAAGLCTGPGDDLADPGGSDDASHSDLNVVKSVVGGHTPSEVSTIPDASHDPPGIVKADDTEGTFAVETSTDNGSTWALDKGWTFDNSTANPALVTNLENGAGTLTGKNNYITIQNVSHYAGWDGAAQGNLVAGTEIKVQFFGTDLNYITNPGSDAYFVKINTYNSHQFQNFSDGYPDAANDCDVDLTTYDHSSGTNPCNQNVIDGGVTVANIMNNSIQIRTKVLETLDFSVGTNDPDTQTAVQLGQSHGPCDPVNNGTYGQSGGVLYLGNASAENSLATNRGYDTFSYWRLSSNSSNGATVYYSGATLSDTESDQIGPIYHITGGDNPGDNTAEFTHPGSEQFGLGLDVKYATGIDSQSDNGYLDDYVPGESLDGGGGSNAGLHAVDSTAVTGFTALVAAGNPTGNYYNSWHLPELFPLVPQGVSDVDGGQDAQSTLSYGYANGSIGVSGAGAEFAFSSTANTIPQPIAAESNLVVNCATGLMRYVGNIAATTPAGIYTTAVNYLAAPEY
jgi:hypothetical protein